MKMLQVLNKSCSSIRAKISISLNEEFMRLVRINGLFFAVLSASYVAADEELAAAKFRAEQRDKTILFLHDRPEVRKSGECLEEPKRIFFDHQASYVFATRSDLQRGDAHFWVERAMTLSYHYLSEECPQFALDVLAPQEKFFDKLTEMKREDVQYLLEDIHSDLNKTKN